MKVAEVVLQQGKLQAIHRAQKLQAGVVAVLLQVKEVPHLRVTPADADKKNHLDPPCGYRADFHFIHALITPFESQYSLLAANSFQIQKLRST